MPKNKDFTKRIIPLFVIVMIGWILVISLLVWSIPEVNNPFINTFLTVPTALVFQGLSGA